MALITQNFNDSKLHPLNETALSKKNISYGSKKVPLSTAPIQDSINLSTKQQVSFKGSPVKVSGIKKFFLGDTPTIAKELLSDITKYIAPTKENSIVHSLSYNVKNEKFGISDEMIRINEPFHNNVIKAFTDLPNLIIKQTKKMFGSEETKKEVEIQFKKAKTRNKLLGLWVNVTKIAGDFDKSITGENLGEIKTILKNGVKGNEEEFSKFFEKRKLSSVYSFKNGKASGILSKENYLEGFVKEISGEIPKSKEESFIEKAKKEYVSQTIDNTIESKQGYILPNYGQSAAMFVARAVSGIIPAWFIAHDFYNLRILNSNDKKQADAEWNSKFKQESGRIGIETYQGYVLNSIFEKLTNKSLPFAVGLNIVNTIGSNVFSRKITGRPVLPVNIDDAAKLKHAKDKKPELTTNTAVEKNTAENPANDEKLNQLKSFNSFRSNKSSIGFGANNTGIINSIKTGLKVLDNKLANAKICQATIDVEKFVESYKKVKQLDRKDARKMLEIAANRMNIEKDYSHLTLQDILDHAKDQKEILIGRNWIYRYSKEAVNIIKFPFEFAGTIGRAVINPVRKLFGKEPLKAPKKGSFYSEQYIKNVTKWADKINKKMGTINDENIEEAIGRYAENKNFFSTKVMEYGANELSTAMKLTGFTTVPFLATDAYNVTLGETKNKDSAQTKRNQRAIQDSSRQGVSLWICYAFNQMGKALSNASLVGNAALVAVQAFTYESLTRMLVGQPLFPTTQEKMLKTEKEKAKSKNWFVKLMAGRLKTNKVASSASTPAANTVTESKTDSLNASDLYKKFSTNNK